MSTKNVSYFITIGNKNASQSHLYIYICYSYSSVYKNDLILNKSAAKYVV